MKTLEGKKREGYSYLKKITAVDYGDRLEVLYFIYNPASHANEIVKVELGTAKPSVDTVIGVYGAADWHERELTLRSEKVLPGETKSIGRFDADNADKCRSDTP